MFQADPDIQGLFACNDVMAMGAVRALEGMGREDVQVVGFDASDDGRAAIKKGRVRARRLGRPGTGRTAPTMLSRPNACRRSWTSMDNP